MTRLALTGAAIVTPDAAIDGHALLIDGAQIAGLARDDAMPAGFEAVDLGGGWLLPGFIDTQVNGGGDILFNDQPTPGGIAAIAAAHRRSEAEKQRLPLSRARENAHKIDWSSYSAVKPQFFGTRVFETYDLEELSRYIDWTPFFQTWELKGRFPAILDDEKQGEAARHGREYRKSGVGGRPRSCGAGLRIAGVRFAHHQPTKAFGRPRACRAFAPACGRPWRG